jgi:hypothetical protein
MAAMIRSATGFAMVLMALTLLASGCGKPEASTTAASDAELRALQQKYDALAAESQRLLDEAARKYQALQVETSNKLGAAEARYQALDEDAKAKITQAGKRETQIRVAFRKVGAGSAAQLTNMGNQPAPVMLRVTRPASDKLYVREITLNPGQLKEIGQKDGWIFAAGDVLTLEQADRRPATFTVP